jgi:hypothetical protein
MTQNYQVRPRPILRQPPTHPSQLSLLPNPQPPTQHREPPLPERVNISRTSPPIGKKLPMRQSIDYEKLTANEQAKWDVGMYGSLHLKNDKGNQYYVVRWYDPRTKTLRSNSLGKDEKQAIARWRKLVLG